jgi:transcriptional regulator with XRE-family HTH domain
MDTPPVPPYGELIEEVREGAGISMKRAADLADVSKQTWNDVVKGRTAAPRARTVARMADAVGLSPERLESEGGHPAAAKALREILGRRPVPVPPAAAIAFVPLSLEGDEETVARAIMDLPSPGGGLVPWGVRRDMLRSLLEINDRRRAGAAG